MKTPHLDIEIRKLEDFRNCNTFWSVAMEEKLTEFKEIKQALSITDVSASKQKVKCTNCSRKIETYKDMCASCRIADALLD